VHDGIHLELAGIPTAVICTEAFSTTGRAMAEVWGAHDFPLLLMPHPLSSRTEAELEDLAEALAPRVADVLAAAR
jgi:hypothetical protein